MCPVAAHYTKPRITQWQIVQLSFSVTRVGSALQLVLGLADIIKLYRHLCSVHIWPLSGQKMCANCCELTAHADKVETWCIFYVTSRGTIGLRSSAVAFLKQKCKNWHWFMLLALHNPQNTGKTNDLHLTGIALSDTDKRYTVGKVSLHAVQTCTHFRSS